MGNKRQQHPIKLRLRQLHIISFTPYWTFATHDTVGFFRTTIPSISTLVSCPFLPPLRPSLPFHLSEISKHKNQNSLPKVHLTSISIRILYHHHHKCSPIFQYSAITIIITITIYYLHAVRSIIICHISGNQIKSFCCLFAFFLSYTFVDVFLDFYIHTCHAISSFWDRTDGYSLITCLTDA